jgi:hypothetical protein
VVLVDEEILLTNYLLHRVLVETNDSPFRMFRPGHVRWYGEKSCEDKLPASRAKVELWAEYEDAEVQKE